MNDRFIQQLAPGWRPGDHVPWYVRWSLVVMVVLALDAWMIVSGSWGALGLPGVAATFAIRIATLPVLVLALRWVWQHRD